MPYDSNNDLPKDIKNVLPAKAQTIYRKAFNSAYESYDGDEEKAIATAWTAVKTKYVKKNNKWGLIETVKSKVVSGGIDFNPELGNEWVAVAKVGQEALLSPDNKIVTYSAEGLINYANNLKSLDITYNHDSERKIFEEQITNAKFEDQFLYMQISEQVKEAIKNDKVSGLSIEGIPKKIKDGVLFDVEGTALTLMEYPQLPACKREEGCGVVSSSILEGVDITQTAGADVDVSVSSQELPIAEEISKVYDVYTVNNKGSTVKIGYDSIYGSKKQLKDKEYIKMELMARGGYHGRTSLQYYEENRELQVGDVMPSEAAPVHVMTTVISKEEPVLAESDNRHLEANTEIEDIKQTSRGGDVEGMDKEEIITYSGDQVKEMVTSAVGEAETILKNQQEVDINALKKTEGKEKEELETKHAAELKETSELAYRKAEAMTKFKAMLNPSEEVLKQADGMPPEAIEFIVGLNISAHEGPTGVTSGSPKGEETIEEKLKDTKTRFNKLLGRGVKEG